ncbi:hypothetical protein VTN77DRAFT_2679 [Rasamsonia byssochlamydoides]|uniref:uncharacterized protein n=1 Tax=Rasamsonia byssochlamydoides TaxID=89139 RepID=UPI00374247F5
MSEPTAQETPQAVPETQPTDKIEETTTTVTAVSEEKPAEKTAEATTGQPAEANGSAAAAETAPATNNDESAPKKDESEAPAKPEFLAKNPALSQFFDRLPAILEKAGHTEMWGVPLKDFNDPPTANILIKFLRANEGNVKQAEGQLTKALEWRKKLNPLELAENARFSAKKFDGLGYITSYDDPKYGKLIFTWNIYGAVKDINGTFGDVDEFIKWRVALMELAIKDLKIGEATSVMDYNGEDPYQMIQVHDYQNVSFLRMNPTIRAASKKTIDVFTTAYPEILREKFFVNVPAIMGWMFSAMKVFLSKNTIRKFHPITNGANLAREFSFADDIPKTYGGKAPELKETGRTVPLEDDAPAEEQPAKEEPAKEEPAKEEAPKEEAAKEEPANAEPAKEEPVEAKEEPAKEEPAKEEPAAAEAAPAATETN